MSGSDFKNYVYQQCPTDEMDNIEKRSGHCKVISSCIISILFVFYVVCCSKAVDGEQLTKNNSSFNHSVVAEPLKNDKSKMIYYFTTLSLWMNTTVAATILHRICLLVEELWHFKSRYGKNYWKFLSTVFSGGWNSLFVVFGVGILIMCLLTDHHIVLSVAESNKNLLIVVIAVLNIFLSQKVWTETEFQHSKSHIPSTGTFMAYAAYYSYYKNVLPKLKERIVNAEKKHNIRIPFKKLIILFPSSGRIPDSLEHGTEEIQRIDHLSSIKTNKEGTHDRKMNNPIYKIAPRDKEPYYCVVEGQNSLPVLKSMKQPKEIFKQQAYLLYNMLKEILNDSGEKDTYHLLCYNDEDEDNPQMLSRLLWDELDRQLKI
ncbi:stimulator of interferon genes protein-like [Centruroides vittatus]|uniref:stimulator of interferon genes protein-like n=1 Tax=Centruroides vittatus TaxID=120091 RepID=UPI0035109248